MPATGDDAGPDIEARECGARLRDARLALGLDRAEAARELGIREAWLEAIEDGRLDELPGAPLRTDLIGSYADRLGFVGASFAARLGGAAEGRRRPGRFFFGTDGRLPVNRVLPIAAVLAAAAGGGWYLAADFGVPAERAVPAPEWPENLPEERPGAGERSGAGPEEAVSGDGTRVTGGAGMPVLPPIAPVSDPPVGEPAGARSEAGAQTPGPSAGPGAERSGGGEETAPVRQSAGRVRAVQRALARLGYDPGPVDGAIGPRTRAALRAYQDASGLAADGRLTPDLEREILSSAAATGS